MKSKLFAAALVAALLVFGLSYASAQGPRTVLKIESVKITKTECGKPLEFQIVIKNAGAQGYNRETAVLVKTAGNQIGTVGPMSIPAGGTFTSVQASPNASFLADCCKEVCFEVSLAATLNGGVVPEWDKVAYKICTKPGNVVVVRR
jgi:hypothetical protein